MNKIKITDKLPTANISGEKRRLTKPLPLSKPTPVKQKSVKFPKSNKKKKSEDSDLPEWAKQFNIDLDTEKYPIKE